MGQGKDKEGTPTDRRTRGSWWSQTGPWALSASGTHGWWALGSVLMEAQPGQPRAQG